MIQNTRTNAIENQTDALQNALLYLLKVFNENNTEYALLHPGDDALPDVSSDIDIILDKPPALSIEPALSKLHDEFGAVWTQSFHYDVPYGYFYVIQIPYADGYAYLQLDCLYDSIGVNRYHLSSRQLLRDKIFDNGFYKVSSISETIYLIIKRSLKGNASQHNVEALSEYINENSVVLKPLLVDWLGQVLTHSTIELCKKKHLQKFSNLLNKSSSSIERRFALRHPLRHTIKRVTTAIRQIKRFFKPTGLFIVLIGPDGCGKTTISTNVRSNMERCFRGIWRFHWRPKLLPKLGRNSGQNTEQSTPNQGSPPAPPEKSKYNTFTSLIRFTYYLADFVIGYWLVIYPKKTRSTLIVGERYFTDILVHPARYGFSLPKWYMRLCSYLVPKPDVTILLYGDPQKIHDRKPELPVATISEQIGKYQSEITHWGEHFSINTTDTTPDQSVHDIERQLGKILESRVTTLPVSNTPDLIFPPSGRPRILINKDIKKTHIEKLYNPGSRLGQLFTAVMYSSPAFIRRMLSRKNKSKYFGLFPVANADIIIKQHLQLPDASVSYYLGNGGPRSKITAQVVDSGKVTAFVKIANTTEAIQLITNESEVLNTLSGSLSIALPDNIGLVSDGEWHYLFQSCPDNFHSLNSYALTKDIECLADEIFNSNRQSMLLDDYLITSSLVNRVDSIAAFGEISADKFVTKVALSMLKDHFSEKPIVTGRSHGDFSAWNIVEDTDKKLFIFDWEYSESPSPALADMVHFTRSRYHFIEQHIPEKLIELLFAELTAPNSIFNKHALRYNIDEIDIPYYAVMYFIRELLRHAETGDGSESTLRRSPNQIKQINYLGKCINSLCEAIKHGAPLKRILVAAYACEADQGSEPGVGWNWVKLISKNNHAWVITKKNNKKSIDSYLSSNPNHNLNFIYVAVPKWLSFWKKGQRGVRTYYYLWQFSALTAARKLHNRVGFHLGHHVTFVNDWLWSFMALMPIPYIWGPIGSHPKVPSGLLPHRRAWLKELIRLSIQRTMRMLDPLYWITAIRAKRIIAINNETRTQFPLSIFDKKKFIVESAIAHEDTLEPGTRKKSDTATILYVGRFHHTKCPHLVIHAFSKTLKKLKNAKLIMVGKGPEETSLKNLADNLGCTGAVEFMPWCSQVEVFNLMASSTLFFFPSAEGGGMVVIEAMAYGLPVICLNYGGPGVMVPDECGYKAPITSKQLIIDNLSQSITEYCLNSDKLHIASEAAKSHAVNNLSWDGKLERISSIYDELLTDKV